MDLKQLRYFMEVVDQGSLHRASKALDIAQPALSRRMKDLEQSVGCRLLDRSVRGVSVTHAGRVLYREATDILDKVADAGRNVRSAGEIEQRGEDRRLSLGLVRSARKYDFVHHALAQLARERPVIRVATVTGTSPKLAAELRSGRLDASLIYEHGMAGPPFADRLIHRERYVLAVNRHHRLASPGPIALTALAGEPFVWLPRGDDLSERDPLLEHCRASGLDPLIAQTTHTQSELIDIVSTSGGLFITPVSTVRTVPDGMLCFRSLPEFVFELDLYLAWNPASASPALDPAIAALQGAIDSHQSDIDGGRAAWAKLDGMPQVRTH